MSQRQSTTCGRLSVLGLDQSEVHKIVDQIHKWSTSNGKEWTVSRLKDMKQMFISLRAGKPFTPSIWTSTHHDGSPKGPFRAMFRKVHSQKPKQFGKALNALMVYTEMINNGSPSKKQWEKFRSSVEDPTPAIDTSIGRDADLLPDLSPLGDTWSLSQFPWSPSRRAPGVGSTVPETDMLGQVSGFYRSAVNHEILTSFERLYEPVLGNMPRFYSYFTAVSASMEDPSSNAIGQISFQQEPGYKLRSFANPFRIHQLALEPLKESLLDTLKNIPEDCTFEQDKGVDFAWQALCHGETVHSVDLSDATNNFPLEYTLSVLREKSTSDDHLDHINLFSRLSKSPWRVKDPITGSKRLMQWTKGQPLGLGPSFAAFALSHHALIQGAQVWHGGDYRILGDDIVIVGDRLKEAYVARLTELGVPVSPSKTISSDKLAEFAGKVITPAGVIPTVKWREISDRNFMDYTRFFGYQFLGALRPRQRRVAKALAEVPEFLGGLGLNPAGKSFSERLTEHWDFIQTDPFIRNDPAEAHYRETSISLEDQARIGFVDLSFNYFRMLNAESQPPSRPETVTTGNPQLDIVKNVGVSSGAMSPNIAREAGLVPSVRVTGDPRGPTALETLESRLQVSSGEDSPDEDMGTPSNDGLGL